MKKVNFNKLNNIKTPESWIENAIKIPQKKKVVPFYLKPYFIATAASVVFCCVLSLLVFFNLGSNTSVFPIASPDSTQATAENESNDNNDVPQTSTQTATDNSGNIILVEPVTNSEGKVIATQPVTDASGNTIVIQPVTEPRESGTSQSTASPLTEPTSGADTTVPTKVTGVPSIEPSEATTSPNTQKPTSSTQPPPTECPTVPTAEPDIEETSFGAPPWWGGDDPAGEPDDETIFDKSIYFIPSKNTSFNLSGNIYCRVEEINGFCATQMYSSAELCQKIKLNNELCYKYTPKDKMNRIVYGVYHVRFYDTMGHYFMDTYYLGADYNIYVYE